MSQKSTRLTGLQARKNLLIVESELNRVQLAAAWRELKIGLEQVTGRIATVSSAAEAAAKIGASVIGFFRGFSTRENKERTNGKKSWLSTVFNGTRAGVSLWSAIRSHLR